MRLSKDHSDPTATAEDVQDTPPALHSADMQERADEEATRIAAERARLAQFAVKLPDEFFETSISTLKIGECTYTVPWMVNVDSDGRCWIKANLPVNLHGGGTCCVQLVRTEHGFDAFLRSSDHKWNRHTVPLIGDYLPITHFNVNGQSYEEYDD